MFSNCLLQFRDLDVQVSPPGCIDFTAILAVLGQAGNYLMRIDDILLPHSQAEGERILEPENELDTVLSVFITHYSYRIS